MAGYVGYLNPGLSWELAHFNANGTLDTTFDTAGAVPGTVTTHFAASSSVLNSLAIYPGTGSDTADYGKIVAVGGILGTRTRSRWGVQRERHPRHHLRAVPRGDHARRATALATAIQADGGCGGRVVPGCATTPTAAWTRPSATAGSSPPPKAAGVRAVAIQADDRIVAAGGKQRRL